MRERFQRLPSARPESFTPLLFFSSFFSPPLLYLDYDAVSLRDARGLERRPTVREFYAILRHTVPRIDHSPGRSDLCHSRSRHRNYSLGGSCSGDTPRALRRSRNLRLQNSRIDVNTSNRRRCKLLQPVQTRIHRHLQFIHVRPFLHSLPTSSPSFFFPSSPPPPPPLRAPPSPFPLHFADGKLVAD